jgi:hypothetical protein
LRGGDFEENGEALENYAQTHLDPELAKKGIDVQLGQLEDLRTLEVSITKEAEEGRWVYLTTRRENQRRDSDRIRCRFVSRDLQADEFRDDLFSPASDQATSRMSDFATTKKTRTRAIIDFVSAYLNALEEEDECCNPLKERSAMRSQKSLDGDGVRKVKKKLNRRPNVGQCWIGWIARVLVGDLGFFSFLEAPQFFYHELMDVSAELHMDDLHIEGADETILALIDMLKIHVPIKSSGPIGRNKRYHLFLESGLLILPQRKRVDAALKALKMEIARH